MKIIYKNTNGGVSVVYPTEEAFSFMTIDEIAKKDVPTGLPYKIVDDSEIPTDRTFRDAWVLDESTVWVGVVKRTIKENKVIKVDLNKAKEIAHNKRRVVREKELQPLDVQATIPMYAEQVELERQVVRDKHAEIQDLIDQAESVEDLKKVIEGIL